MKKLDDNDYTALSARLGEVVAEIQSADIQVDEAIALYEEGMALAQKIQHYLESAENRIKKVKSSTKQ